MSELPTQMRQLYRKILTFKYRVGSAEEVEPNHYLVTLLPSVEYIYQVRYMLTPSGVYYYDHLDPAGHVMNSGEYKKARQTECEVCGKKPGTCYHA